MAEKPVPSSSIWSVPAYRVILTFFIVCYVLFVGITTPQDAEGKFDGIQVQTSLLGKLFVKLDSYWYISIVQHGYGWTDEGMSNSAFFPAYPALMTCLSYAGISPVLAGVIVSHIAFCFVIVCAYLFVKKRRDSETANWSLIWLCVFPTAWAFQMVYTESLFCAALFGFFLLYDRQHYKRAAVCVAILPMVRAVGFAVVPAIMCDIAYRWWRDRQFPYSRLWILGGGVLGALGVMGFYQLVSGSPIGFIHATESWPTHAMTKGAVIPLLSSIICNANRPVVWVYVPFILAYFVGTLVVLRKKCDAVSLYCLFYVLMLTRISHVSQLRYLLPLLPVHVLYATWVFKSRFRLVGLMSMVGLQIIVTILIVTWNLVL